MQLNKLSSCANDDRIINNIRNTIVSNICKSSLSPIHDVITIELVINFAKKTNHYSRFYRNKIIHRNKAVTMI